MDNGAFPHLSEINKAYQDWDRTATIFNFKVACYIGLILMPAGYFLDQHVYPGRLVLFLKLRLLSDVFIAGFLVLLLTQFAKKHYRSLGVALAMVPSSFLSLMIYKTDYPEISPYYAGLNLVLLVFGFVMHWTFRETLIAVCLVISLYIAACLASWPIRNSGMFFNNIYFLVLTGIIIATGRFFHSRLRFREFALRFELDQNRKALESSLQQLKETEMQLVQSEKLASLGRMSAGIIHEINNPLNFATTGLYMLRNKRKFLAPEQQEEYAEIVNDVEEGIKRVTTIVSDLRTFSHPDAGQRDEVQVAEVVAAALRFVSNEWKNIVQVETSIAREQTIWVNKNKFIHVLVNLLQNSLDAMKEKSFDGEKPAIQITGRVEHGRSVLSIRDNGPGIDAKHLDKVFDPFYTTKEVGAGMGLGLSICHRIVQENGGKISVITEPGRFCEFTLEFPEKG
jgi:two-component system sensor histidine kinase PhcS